MSSKILKKKIKIEIAKTPSEKQKGLMYRKSLDSDSGMLFIFDKSQKMSFWGANTYIPLDIAFIKENKIIDIKEIIPLSTKAVTSNEPCELVLEVSLDFFKNNDISIGDFINIEEDEILFLKDKKDKDSS